uniref:Uncharacterized protein n=1 Tax=Anguilla anguilla TaxID=7936 RepID=A0A0E9R3R7_ANGAN
MSLLNQSIGLKLRQLQTWQIRRGSTSQSFVLHLCILTEVSSGSLLAPCSSKEHLTDGMSLKMTDLDRIPGRTRTKDMRKYKISNWNEPKGAVPGRV